jgi:hypothetical protein
VRRYADDRRCDYPKHPALKVVLFCIFFSKIVPAAVFDASQHLATGASNGAEYVTNQIIPVSTAAQLRSTGSELEN